MLRFLSGGAKLCNGVTRREVLRVGGHAALFGSLAGAVPLGGAEPDLLRVFGRAKSIIFITLYGGPPQTETFDMKPDAPLEVRGPFKPIPSSVVDLHVCEHLPRLAKLAHLYTVVRSFSHTNTAHGGSLYTHLTGWPYPIINQNFPSTPEDHPHYGAVVSALKPPQDRVPAAAIVGGRILPQFDGIGQTGGYLGQAHSPFVVEGNPRALLTPKDETSTVRIRSRHRLLQELQSVRSFLDKERKAANFSVVQDQALRLLDSKPFVSAFDLKQEPDETRDRYGRHFLGEYVLLARRLVEAGVPMIQVSDVPPGKEQQWDLHYSNIFTRLKDGLLPRLDQATSALLTDLHERGLLDETLVVVGGEFGRTPWIDHLTDPPQGGRQHWPFVYSTMLAGGGVRRGEVFGASDEIAAYPISHKVAPWDLGATVLHLAGIDPRAQVTDRKGRLRPVCRGDVIRGILL